MPYTYQIEERLVHVSWQGVVAEEDLASFGETMPRVGREMGFAPDVLHTFAEVTGCNFQPLAAYAYSLVQKRARIPNPIRAAIVAASPQGKALAKVFKALNRTRNLEMEVFNDEASARAWLAKTDGTAV